MKSKPKILFIEWLDACGTSGWKDKSKIQTEPSRIQSVGFLVEETKEALTLAQSESLTNQNYANCVVIPKACIKSKRVL